LSNNKMGTGQYRVHKLLMFFDYLHTYCYNLSASFPSWARFWVRIIPRLPFIYLFIVPFVFDIFSACCVAFFELALWDFPKPAWVLPTPHSHKSTFIVFTSFSTRAFCDTQPPT
jgi:hypothetical protein